MSTDFYPTLLEMAGLPLNKEQHLDGLSLTPLFNGNQIARKSMYWHFPHYQKEGSYPGSAIRKGDYKLIINYHHNDLLLYNIKEDPNEKDNLATRYPDKAQEFKKELLNYLNDVGAYIPTKVE